MLEYKTISEAWCMSAADKARKIERYLNELSPEGWEYVALDPMTVFGLDVGFYLVLSREKAA